MTTPLPFKGQLHVVSNGMLPTTYVEIDGVLLSDVTRLVVVFDVATGEARAEVTRIGDFVMRRNAPAIDISMAANIRYELREENVERQEEASNA